ncbi:hypothetical protein OA93_20435 [Flavobacterium sp. KMS]|uniref:hypothetical protein n=1 Tax=Flavobacterium sp. KMS TaxID=1566023 RepID=UPI00057FADBB|nr:hypothetical protein [Flavobacterium sp. KMS]KIA94497.1 hypothetical protein OA93_20435 [Flavobacterium sp. KMS]
MFKKNNITKLSCYLLSLLLCSCGDKYEAKKKDKSNSSIDTTDNKKSILKIDKEDNYGLLVLKNSYNKKNLIKIYNRDNSIWKSFKFDDFFSDIEIMPYAIKPENNLLVFKTLKKEKGFYEIVVNESDENLIKFIKISDSNFEYQTLAEHILTVVFVNFDDKTNPLYEEPNIRSKQLLFNKDEDYYPIKIKDDWLMIEDSNNKNYWIRWRDSKGKLIIELLYDA